MLALADAGVLGVALDTVAVLSSVAPRKEEVSVPEMSICVVAPAASEPITQLALA